MRKKTTLAFVTAAIAALTVGCTNSSDTSGFKPEKKPTKDELTAQIAQVKANAKMPPSIKAMALQKLEKQLADAR